MSEENVEIVRRTWEGLGDANPSWLDLYDEACEIRNPPEFPARGPFVGHAGVRQWRTEIWEVFSELRHEVTDLIDLDDRDAVLTIQRTVGRMRHTGLPVNVEWASVFTLREGKVFRAQGYSTRAEALEAAGLSE